MVEVYFINFNFFICVLNVDLPLPKMTLITTINVHCLDLHVYNVLYYVLVHVKCFTCSNTESIILVVNYFILINLHRNLKRRMKTPTLS